MVSDGLSSGAKDEPTPEGFTEEDLRLGRKASKTMDRLCVIALVACLAMAAFVLINVPWDTRMPYSGRFGRNGIPAPVALIPALIVLFGFWRSGKKSDSHHMRKGSRVGMYIAGGTIVLACVFFQWRFAEAILIEGGFLSV
ncbi:hypothetical protein [Arthrobacter pityocampae]|uniref:hypothetical protein n=1 Tax=Arthrobacter pityocampae TaxID=547334 RepID=UPI0037370BF4